MDLIRRTRPIGVIAAVVLLTGLMACVAPDTHASPEGRRPTSPADDSPGGQGRNLAESASGIDSYLRQAYPDCYAGLVLDQAGGSLIVYRRECPGLDSALRERFARAPMEIRGAPHSARDLATLAARISDDIAYWAERGIPITSVAPRQDGTAVEVGTREVRKASAELPDRYGTAIPIDVIEADPVLPTAS